ncbi:alkaline phosphatase-like protein [Basidiobolus meristosporus CBS 931.73]|uniref:Alkaline phosphatase-like protein n=1 Tax=Basidiobolus meristosporus CBS 931.73 TaxID=1314790 RepID=A0A1Y1YT09_9FUNG|nr:alkaline phosphatase-like protein [Basidiobolus meristosporus CBS 931.73]|eukprot:ORY01168.1 alkaline phosphatase-like protein [Basidiobolus meristosporus CBS 931.73]
MSILFPFAGRTSILGKAYISTTFISCIVSKVILASDYFYGKPSDVLWVPSTLFLDWAYLQAIVFLLDLAGRPRKLRWLRVIFMCFLYILVIWSNLANMMTVTFYLESQSFLNWYTMRDLLANVTAAQAGMAVNDLALLAFMFSGFISLWLALYLVLRYRMSKVSLTQSYIPVERVEEAFTIEEALYEESDYLTEPKPAPVSSRFSWSRENLRETIRGLLTKRNMAYGFCGVLLIIYAIVCMSIRPTTPWSQLDGNFGAKSLCIMLVYPYISHSGPMIVTSAKYPMTNEFLTKFSNMRFGGNSTMQDEDFAFLKRNGNSAIKNVVFMILETTRNDVVPFDYFSEFSERLEKEFRDEQRSQTLYPNGTEAYDKGVSPFFEDLMRRGGFYMPYMKSLTGYTLKSLTTTHCGMMPLRTPGASERTHPFYQTCLPELLKKHSDYKTAYFQTSDGTFDNQRELMLKFGFDLVLDRQTIDNEGVLDKYTNIPRLDNGKFEEINYFGYEDEIIVPKMVDWIGEQEAAGKPFFLTHLNNVAHHPYGQPKRWKKVNYLQTPDDPVNDYLNSIRYVDDFMKNFLNSFEQAHPKAYQETLFMFVGDHGVSLREHHIMHAHQNPYEYAFNVPFLFYSPNDGVQKYLTQQFRKNLINKDAPEVKRDGRLQTLYQRGASNLVLGNWTNLDILPTMLNLFKENPVAELGSFDYEGSSVTGVNDPKRVTLSIATPGGYSTSLRYGTHKLLKINDGTVAYYDLSDDPTELQPKRISELSEELREWALAADEVTEEWNNHINRAYQYSDSA